MKYLNPIPITLEAYEIDIGRENTYQSYIHGRLYIKNNEVARLSVQHILENNVQEKVLIKCQGIYFQLETFMLQSIDIDAEKIVIQYFAVRTTF